MKNLIKVEHISKAYDDKTVVKDVSFDVYEGEILCILGPNGAGKSTMMKMLCGVLGYDKGSILSQEQSIYENLIGYKAKLGVVPQDIALYEDLSAWQNICFFAALYGLRGDALKASCEQALQFVGLQDRASDKVATFSGGMKRRLNIACAIAHHPTLLIMDEPTVGVDPQSRNHILDSIKQLQSTGMSIVYTTHYMEEVEAIATRIIIIDNGEIIAEGTKESLKEQVEDERTFVVEVEAGSQVDKDVLYQIAGMRSVKQTADIYTLETVKSVDNLDLIIVEFMKQGAKIRNISCIHATLETVFLKMTGKSLRD